MIDAPIEPAMTPERWRSSLAGQHFFRGPHRIAALALYHQPFGFTHTDVEWIRWAASAVGPDPRGEYRETKDTMDAARAKLLAIADRIAALLPPEDYDPAL